MNAVEAAAVVVAVVEAAVAVVDAARLRPLRILALRQRVQ